MFDIDAWVAHRHTMTCGCCYEHTHECRGCGSGITCEDPTAEDGPCSTFDGYCGRCE